MKNRQLTSIATVICMLIPVILTGQQQDPRTLVTPGKPATVRGLTRRSLRRRSRLPAMFAITGIGDLANDRAQSQDRPAPPTIEPQYVEGQVLVQLKPDLSNSISSETKNAFQTKAGLLTATEVYIPNATDPADGQLYVGNVSADKSIEESIAALQKLPGVEFAEPNWIYTKAQAPSNDPSYANGLLWGMYSDDTSGPFGPDNPTGITTNVYGIQAEKTWANGHTGSHEIFVGIIDEGIQVDHPDLRDNIWINPGETGADNAGRDKSTNGEDDDDNGYVDDVHGFDFFWNDGSVYDGQLSDDPSTRDVNEAEIDAHGTHVAGTIGGVGGNGVGIAGVNWHVKMIAAKFLGPLNGSTDKAVKAIDYFIMLKREKGLNLVAINASWGGGGYSRALHNALKRAAAANILVIAAAGNGDRFHNPINNDRFPYYPASYDTTQATSAAGPGQPQEPGFSYDNVISVASIASDGGIASSSNYGKTQVDLGAPGVRVMSVFPRGRYEFLNGTSMAAPHVTGAVALYASIHPQAPALAIRQVVLDSARSTPTASLANKTVTGGRLNIGSF